MLTGLDAEQARAGLIWRESWPIATLRSIANGTVAVALAGSGSSIP
ncbi:MAG: hypothetical protein QM756_32605 [Polyangiaceae bacterium]